MLTLLAVGPGQPFPYISGLSNSLAVLVRDPENRGGALRPRQGARGLPRFLEVGKRSAFVPLEAVIVHFLDWLFPQMEIVERAVFRVTRDADFYVPMKLDDYRGVVEPEPRRRRLGRRQLEVSGLGLGQDARTPDRGTRRCTGRSTRSAGRSTWPTFRSWPLDRPI